MTDGIILSRMATKNEDNGMMHYNEFKAYDAVHHHFSGKHKVKFYGLINRAKYTRKRIKIGTLAVEQRLLFEELAASRAT
ncbi:MAG: hypothetical protein Q4E68_02910 [Prevotellaceae bacterium]|nr:hypothetical protein [Prevotellaceae bacterium]